MKKTKIYILIKDFPDANFQIEKYSTENYKDILEKYKIEKNSILKDSDKYIINSINLYVDKIIKIDYNIIYKHKRIFEAIFARKDNKSKFIRLPF